MFSVGVWAQFLRFYSVWALIRMDFPSPKNRGQEEE